MAEPVVEEENHPDPPSFSSELDSIAITSPPPFGYNSSSDQALLGNSISDLSFSIDCDVDFELTFDSIDDLYFPSENESLGADCGNVSEATIVSSSSTSSEKFKLEEEEEEATTYKTSTTKRKKENEEEDTSEESRSSKYMRSNEDDDDDEKRNVRLIRNRESAQLSRQRKKHYVEELQDKVKNLQSVITDLNSKVSYFMAENATLRMKVGPGSGMCWQYQQPQSHSGMYPPLAQMAYPWMPYPAYMVKQQGSQVVPLIPIPRLKPRKSVGKVKNSEAKTKTKVVASVSVLGLLFCLFLFGALAPIVELSYGGVSGVFYGEFDQLRGRVLDVSVNSSSRCSDQGVGRNVSETENSVPIGSNSELLVASLFVPRDEKLVKLDGNLIIHSVLASEKDLSSETEIRGGKSGAAATMKGISHALPLSDSKRTRDLSENLNSEKRKALSSSGYDDSNEKVNSTTTGNGKMQQWFREGVAGPMFSSGMCSEVFQFDVSTTSGAIIPASPATQQLKNTTDTHKGKSNRRILRDGLPVSEFNVTEDQNSSSKENFREIKPFPSMVVSVLVDPREGSDGDIDGTTGSTKSLSRVFIVVLVDGVKYVTYSCVLPRPEVPHLVTT